MAKQSKHQQVNEHETAAEKQARVDAFVAEQAMEKAEAAGFPVLTEKDFIDVSDSAKSLAEITEMTNLGIMSTHKSYRILQVAAVNLLRHVEQHKNVTVITQFVKEIDDAYLPSDKMILFMVKFAPLSYDSKEKVFKYDPKAQRGYDIKNASLKPWWKVGGKSAPKEWNIYAAFAQFLKSAENHTLNAKENDVTDEMFLAKLAKLDKEIGATRKAQATDSLNEEAVRSEKVA